MLKVTGTGTSFVSTLVAFTLVLEAAGGAVMFTLVALADVGAAVAFTAVVVLVVVPLAVEPVPLVEGFPFPKLLAMLPGLEKGALTATGTSIVGRGVPACRRRSRLVGAGCSMTTVGSSRPWSLPLSN